MSTTQHQSNKTELKAVNNWSYAVGSPIAVNTAVNFKSGTVGFNHYLTGFTIQNTHATVPTEFVIKDGSTIVYRGWLVVNMLLPSVVAFPTPIKFTAGNGLQIQMTTTGASVFYNAQGYTLPQN